MAVELLTPFVRRLRQLGPEIEQRATQGGLAILANAGMQLRALSDLQVRIPHEVGMALQENGIAATGDPANGLRAGAAAEPGDFGIFEHLTGSAATLRHSAQIAQHYMPLLYDGAELTLVEDDVRAIWRYRLLEGVSSVPASNDYVVAGFLRCAQRQLGLDAPPLGIRLMHQEPSYAAEYERLFRAPVTFGHAYNEIIIPRIALDLPLVGANPSLHELLKRYADELLPRVPMQNPFTQRVRSAVQQRLASGAMLPEVARVMSLSERSLRRRLADEGVTYSTIVDGVRHDVALRMLGEPEVDIAQIAFALGFAHATAFNRAFRRWHAMSPSEFLANRPRNAFHRFYVGSTNDPVPDGA